MGGRQTAAMPENNLPNIIFDGEFECGNID